MQSRSESGLRYKILEQDTSPIGIFNFKDKKHQFVFYSKERKK